jgi:hypothetical protein
MAGAVLRAVCHAIAHRGATSGEQMPPLESRD